MTGLSQGAGRESGRFGLRLDGQSRAQRRRKAGQLEVDHSAVDLAVGEGQRGQGLAVQILLQLGQRGRFPGTAQGAEQADGAEVATVAARKGSHRRARVAGPDRRSEQDEIEIAGVERWRADIGVVPAQGVPARAQVTQGTGARARLPRCATGWRPVAWRAAPPPDRCSWCASNRRQGFDAWRTSSSDCRRPIVGTRPAPALRWIKSGPSGPARRTAPRRRLLVPIAHPAARRSDRHADERGTAKQPEGPKRQAGGLIPRAGRANRWRGRVAARVPDQPPSAATALSSASRTTSETRCRCSRRSTKSPVRPGG